MPGSLVSISLFDRLRHAAPLRALLVIAALFASQSSLACALEDVPSKAGATAAYVEDSTGHESPADTACCALCAHCSHGSCCTIAANCGNGEERFALKTVEAQALISAQIAQFPAEEEHRRNLHAQRTGNAQG